jgi:voltage-dependent calcium channel T type alpha-1G
LTTVFTLEALLKIIAFGFANCGSRSYIRSLWNQLDFIIVVISLISLVLPTNNLSSIKVVRLMKVLRPLRVISKNEGLKISIKALGVALPGIIDVIVVLFIFIFICGVIGVNYFKGRFFDCDYAIFETEGSPINVLGYQIETKWDCINSGAEWKNSFINFDSITDAMQTFFILSTAVGWSDIMYQAATIKGLDLVHSQ